MAINFLLFQSLAEGALILLQQNAGEVSLGSMSAVMVFVVSRFALENAIFVAARERIPITIMEREYLR